VTDGGPACRRPAVRALAALVATALLSVGLALAAPAARPATSATTAASDLPGKGSDLDRQAIPRQGSAGDGKSSDSPPGSTPGGLGLDRVLLALGVVLGAILALRWLGKRFLNLPSSASAAGAIRVLGQVALGARQQLLLIQVGRRLILAANSPTQTNALCELTDPDEVAQVIAKVARGGEKGAGAFEESLKGAQERFEPSEEPKTSAGPSAPSDEPALTQTKQELTGLMDKVRMLARRFKS